MGRAQQAAVQGQGNNLLNTENTNAATTGGAATAGLLAQQKNPGYTPGEETSITGATEGGIGAAYGSASEGVANRAARTNNAGGLTSTQDALARQRMITSGNLADQNATNAANVRIAGTNTANAGLASLFGHNLAGANTTLGTLAGNAKTPGFWDTLGSSFAQGLGSSAGSGAGGMAFG